MKKITLLAAVLIAASFASCKKSYSCECKMTVTDPSTGEKYTKTETQAMSEKMKEKQAAAACNQTAKQVTNNVYGLGAGDLTVETVCGIK